MEETWIRARTPEQKLERRREILDTAAELFQTRDYAQVSLNTIARKAGFTKSNVYRYFATREEIFLQLYLDSAADWTSSLCAALRRLPKGADALEISRAWTRVTARKKRFLELNSRLAISLERNSSEETLIRARTRFDALLERILNELRNFISGLTEAEGFTLLIYFQALAAGLWPLANPNETLNRVLDRPEFLGMRVHFDATMLGAMRLFLEGIIQRTSNGHGETR